MSSPQVINSLEELNALAQEDPRALLVMNDSHLVREAEYLRMIMASTSRPDFTAVVVTNGQAVATARGVLEGIK